ncbi:MAG: glycogen/starch synthase [Bacteroidales bacterium]|nr:glycogen/starch synthase [Bacteroidales bacterium]
MESKKVLFVSQEITPYLPETELSLISRSLPQAIQETGKEIRTFMPKYGNINERRNQLHEVIRLSGMNLIIDDTDHPLIIKVASIQAARMQVYFIDNEDYFHHRHTVVDAKGDFFKDNDERMIFFARGVLETVRKLRWSPDLVHCHGWFTSLVPLYIKKAYREDPLFADSKVAFSFYDNGFDLPLDHSFAEKILVDGVSSDHVSMVKDPGYENLISLAATYSDGLIQGSPSLPETVTQVLKKTGKPYLDYVSSEKYVEEFAVFYDSILSN